MSKSRGVSPKVLLVVLASVLLLPLAAAQEGQDPDMPSLTGVTWEWRYFADGQREMNVLTDSQSITFNEDGTYFGRADCNSVSGTYSVSGGSIVVRPGPTTLMACPPDSLGEEFMRYLLRAVIYSFTDDGSLMLELPADSGTLLFTARPQVSGQITYLQRVALPDDAVVRVQIQDVSRVDIAADIIAEQVFTTGGAQVPLAFTVSYPASSIQETRRYSLSARITDRDGRLLFINDEYVPVITGGSPTTGIEIVLVQIQR